MMGYMVQALMLTWVIVVVDIFGKQVKRLYWYVIIFLWMLFGQWVFASKAHANEMVYEQVILCEMTEEARKEIEFMTRVIKLQKKHKALTPSDYKYYQDKVKFHTKNVIKSFKEAKQRCWYLPDLTDRQNAKYCWTSAAALLAPGTPQFKAGAVILNLLLQYGLDCNDE